MSANGRRFMCFGTLGLPEPTMGCIDKNAWNQLIFETTKPVVEKNRLEGVYDAGIAYSRSAIQHSDKLEIMQQIGEVVTTWLLYGPVPLHRYDHRQPLS
ncbi:hypothetical protein CQ12_16530 [Bradyrhizobium jicamae]|uniref:Uncharacterized protein n=1 Tax=Bradyrhizobium jicamae TaxID=280332 RepID=A0A0R3LF44_9BRAD|nr:hypothetical protein [Bradyrhizobium jicamae]KRR06436.1 hypothetical protein CQ12_16530 [Bradyrhizobium jicamae]